MSELTNTSSPRSTPTAISARCNAAVPLESAATAAAPVNSVSSASNASMSGPAGATQLESKAASSSSRSCAPTSGGDNRIFQDDGAVTRPFCQLEELGWRPTTARLTGMPRSLRILAVCTHNRSRSVMMDGLLVEHAVDSGLNVTVRSAGFMENGGEPPTGVAVRLLDDRGIDLSNYRSHCLSSSGVAGADLIVTAEHQHVLDIAARWPTAYGHTFTLPEIVELGEWVGGRGERTHSEWLAALHAERPDPLELPRHVGRRDPRSHRALTRRPGRPASLRSTTSRLDSWTCSLDTDHDRSPMTGASVHMPDVKRIVKRTGLLVDRMIPPPDGITILIYHRVGGRSDSQVDLDPDMFDRQLEYLAEHHRVLSLDNAMAEITAGTAEGWAAARPTLGAESIGADDRRGVVITFDDGTADFTDVVVPTLDRHELPATLFVATRYVDEQEDFPWGAPPTSWSALRDSLTDGNVTIGSHTHAHWLLDRLDSDAIAGDLNQSIELIGEHLGVQARHFAYPKALPGSPSAEIAVRQRFVTASLAASRVNRPGRTDLHRLWRTPIQRSDGFDTFTMKADGGLRLEGELRSLTARARYWGDDR